jgi:hypothetical protein
MRAPDRGSSLKDTITDFLKSTRLIKGARDFLIRLRDDDDKCIDRIWKVYTTKGVFPDTPEGRLKFVGCLCDIWNATFISDTMVVADLVDRNIKLKLKAAGVLVSKIVMDKAVPREVKADLLSKASEFFEKVKFCSDDDLLKQKRWLSVRSDHDGTRQHTAFIRAAATFFRETTGEWHDKEVADLTDIAFPPDEDGDVTSIEMVRSARRGVRP